MDLPRKSQGRAALLRRALPRDRSRGSAEKVKAADISLSPAPDTVRILIVEDSVTDTEMMIRALSDEGLALNYERVETKRDYLAGLANAPNLILADYRLPRFSGMEALQLLQEQGLDIPLIIVSGAMSDEQAAELIKLGASDFLLKDRLGRLAPAVRAALQLKVTREAQHRQLIRRKQAEEALRSSEEHLRATFEQAAVGIALRGTDPRNPRLLRVNRKLCDILGYSEEELLQLSSVDITPPGDRELAIDYNEKMLRGEITTYSREKRYMRKDGRIIWVDLSVTAVRAADGHPTHVISIIQDISERKEAEHRIKRLNRVYAVLSGINTLIVRVRDTQELFREACRIAVEDGAFAMAWIGKLDPVTLDVRAVAWAGVEAEGLAQMKATARSDCPEGNGVMGHSLRERKPVFVNDIVLDPRPGGARRQEALRQGYRSLISLPLFNGDDVMGNLSLYASEPNVFDNDEVRLLTELAGDISYALDYIHKQERINHLNRVYAMLSGISSAIVRIKDRQELLNEACRIAVELGKFGIAWIGILHPQTLDVVSVAQSGLEDNEQATNFRSSACADDPRGQGVVGRAIRERRPVFANDISTETGVGERRKEAIRRGYRSRIGLPLVVEDEVVGIMVLFASEQNFFSDEEVKPLSDLAHDVSFALEHIEAQKRIETLSRTRAVSSGIRSTIVRARDREELFRESCRIAVDEGQFPFAWIGSLDPTTQDVTPVAWAGNGAQELTRAKSSARADSERGKGAVGQAVRERRPIVNSDIIAKPFGGPRMQAILDLGFRSLITLPLFEAEAVIGTLTIYATEPDFFDEEEVRLLTELAGDISFAVENIARQHSLDKLTRIRAVSSEINAAIARIRSREALLKEICRVAVEYGKFELVWVGLIDQEKRQIEPVAWAGFSPEVAHKITWPSLGVSGVTLAEVIRTQRPAVRNDIGVDMAPGVLRQEALKRGYHSTVCLPFLVEGNVMAAAILFAAGSGFFDTDEMALLTEVANDVSFALDHIVKSERLNYLAYYDTLTGLPNRTLLQDHLGRIVRRAKEEGTKASVVMCDIQRFRNINETLGRQGGDALLRALGQRLQGIWPESDNVGHIAADCFAGVLANIKDAAEVAHLIEKSFVDTLNRPIEIDGKKLRIAVTAGIALFPDDGEDADALLRNAEAALKNAKTIGERYLFYRPQMNAAVAETLLLENKLRQALETEQFVLHYQPKVDLLTGALSGFEALIRWNDPETGLVPPLKFIPLLEDTGLILEVGRWAMRKALRDYQEWHEQGLRPPRIAVNVSPIQLRQKDFVSVVREVVAGSALQGLNLEITESLLMEDTEENIEKLRAIRAMDIDIAIDDFGTGYSSLRYLAKLPVNALKIDRSFIITMADNPDSMSIVSTIISLAHSLNLKVIAEGVESEEQRKFLKLLKCDEIQGYLVSKPVPAENIPSMLEARR